MSIESAMKQLCTDLVLELLPKAATATGVPIPPEIIRIVLKAFIELLTEENNLSERLETFLGSYYKGAVNFLAVAQIADRVETRNKALDQAIEGFNTASIVEKDPLLMIKSQFYIGVCYDLQNEKNVARIWYERAFTSATELAFQLQSYQSGILTKAVDGMIKPINAFGRPRSDVGKFAAGVLAALTGGPLVWTPVFSGVEIYEKHKKRMAAQQRMEIERILFFMASLVPVLQAHGSMLDLDPF